MKKIILLACMFISTVISTSSYAQDEILIKPSSKNAVKNIIMVIGDGMGPAYTTAYRYYQDNKKTPLVELTVFDELLIGMASTYPAQSQGYITDSAAAATALATGHKTYNGAIAVDTDKKPLLTLMERAKQLGKKTGLAVTSHINHATPAAYFSHNDNRKNYNAIADSYFDEKINGHFKADLMLGGGKKFFIRPDRNLVKEFKDQGYQYIDNLSQLNNLNKQQGVLGLFADVGLPWALDSQDKQRLLTMTKSAIKYLNNEQGYILLVEASQIDWAGHKNDIAAAMGEMQDLANTLTWLKDYVESKNDTLLVITADHSTGGLTLAANNDYRWQPDVLTTITASPDAISRQLAIQKHTLTIEALSKILGFTLTEQEYKLLANIQDERSLYQHIKQIIDIRTNTGWTTGGHTGVDVQVFATGIGSHAFSGHQTNTDIAKKLFSIISK